MCPKCGRNKGIDRECTTAAAVVRILGGKFLEVHNLTIYSAPNEKPVIPGSSFAGAIRHRVSQILSELADSGAKLPVSAGEITKRMFGDAADQDGHASNIIISEAQIEGARPLTMVRTGISRFESAVKDGTLYKEKTYVGGHFTLEIAVRKGKNPEEGRWMIGILLLALKDLQNGYLAVGGQTAVGRGTFYPDGPISIAGMENELIAEAFKGLCAEMG